MQTCDSRTGVPPPRRRKNCYSTVCGMESSARSDDESGLGFKPPSHRGVGFGVGFVAYGIEEQGKARRNRLGQAAKFQPFATEMLKNEKFGGGAG